MAHADSDSDFSDDNSEEDDEDDNSDDDDDGDQDPAKSAGRAFSGPFASRQMRQRAARAVFVSIERTIGACLVAAGAPAFLAVVPLDSRFDAGVSAAAGGAGDVGVSGDRAWVLRLLRRHLRFTSTPLAFFTGPMLTAARIGAGAARAASAAGNEAESRQLGSRALQIWALFPQVCAAPSDLATAFTPELCKLLVGAMGDARFPQLKRIVASGLGVLITRCLLATGDPLPMRPSFMGDSASGASGGDDASISGMTFMGGISAFDLEGGASFLGSMAGSQAGGAGADDGEGAENDDDLLFGGGMGGGRQRTRQGGKGSAAAGAAPALVDGAAAAHPSLAAALGKGSRPATLDAASARAGLESVKAQAIKLVPVLCKQYQDAAPVSASNAQRVLECLTAYACIAPIGVVAHVHKVLMGSLAKETAAANAAVTAAIQARTSIAEDAAVKTSASRVGALLSLGMAIVPRMPLPQAEGLFTALKPFVDDHRVPIIQKRAYKLLVVLAAHNPAFVSGAKRGPVAELLLASLSRVSPSAQRGRLEALRLLCLGLENLSDPEQAALVPRILAEVVLCVKSTSKRIRSSALAVVLQLATQHAELGPGEPEAIGLETFHAAAIAEAGAAGKDLASACRAGDHSLVGLDGGASSASSSSSSPAPSPSPPASAAAAAATTTTSAGSGAAGASLASYLGVLARGYGAADTGMRSASVLCVARVLFEQSELELASRGALPRLVLATLSLLPDAPPEVARAVILFIRIALRIAAPPVASGLVPSISRAIFGTEKAIRKRIRLPLRNLIDVLVRRFGEAAVSPYVPADDAALFRYVVRMRRRVEKKHQSHLDQIRAASAADADADEAGGLTADGAMRALQSALAGETDAAATSSSRTAGVLGGVSLGPSVGADGKFVVGGEKAARIAAAVRAASAPSTARSDRDEAFEELLNDERDEEAMAMTAAMTEADHATAAGASAARGGTVITGRSARRAGLAARAIAGQTWLVGGRGTDPTDLLDSTALAGALTTDPRAATRQGKRGRAELEKRRRDKDLSAGVALADDGRVVVTADDAVRDASGAPITAAAAARGGTVADNDDDMDSDDEIVGREGLTASRRAGARAASGRRGATSSAAASSSAAARSGSRRQGRKQTAGTKGRGFGGRPDPHGGSAYKSKSGKGDARRSGQTLEPYAYVPLSGGGNMTGKFEDVTASTMGRRKAGKRSASAARGKRTKR